ncbi:MAG: cupredoxin family copper-binding protein [Thermomicrobiales bacterium]
MTFGSHHAPSVRTVALTIMVLAAVVGSGGLSALAARHDDHAAAGPYPAHIHTGTCDALGEVVHPLTDASHAEGEQRGTNPSLIVTTSITTIPASLADLLAAPHALNVHRGADDMGTYVACGDLGGVIVGDELVIGLSELGDSGLSGVAILQEAGEETEVRFYLTLAKPAEDAGGAASTPIASPVADAAEADVTVEITDFAYRDATLEVPAGTTVRWVNNDVVPHTVTSTSDDGALMSGTMSLGDAFTFTFTEPGTYEYICSFHDNMVGTVVVT